MTAQSPDYLTINGRTFAADECIPLGQNPRIITVTDQNARASLGCFNTTSCWRGYVADWLFERERLFLAKLRGQYALLGNEPLLATWLSGTLILPLQAVSTFNSIEHGPPFPMRAKVFLQEGVALSFKELDWMEPARNSLR